MKRNAGSVMLPVLMLMLPLGLAAFYLRTRLYTEAVDAKGLLLRGHPLGIWLVALTVGAILLTALVAWSQNKLGYTATSLGNLVAAVGKAAAGAGILVTVLTAEPIQLSYLTDVWKYLGLAAPGCLLLAGITRALGKRPFFLLYVAACLFFLVHIVTRYQLWSANPQLQDYVFALLGAMVLMFFGFYEASQEAGCDDSRMKLGMGLAAIYLCCAELARSSCPALYLGGILWVLTELVTAEKREEQ